MASRKELNSALHEHSYVTIADVEDVDSAKAKIVKISDDMSMALKHTDRGSDPLTIINKTGMRYIYTELLKQSTSCIKIYTEGLHCCSLL